VKYSTFDRELLAAFSTIRHFRFLLEGRQFQLLTDHKPLVAAMTRVSPPQSARQQRHLMYIHLRSQAHSRVRKCGCRRSFQASCSHECPSCRCASPLYSRNQFAAGTAAARHLADTRRRCAADRFFGTLRCTALLSRRSSYSMLVSPSLSVVSKKIGTAEVLGDVSTGVFRPLLPARFRSAAVLSLHNIHHPGVRASRRLVCASFCWPKMGVFVSALV
jgi:hypothetical protein